MRRNCYPIKIIVNENKRCGDFWLTGSQMSRMMKIVSESLAIRAVIMPMLGLSNSELQRQHLPHFKSILPKILKRLDVTRTLKVSEVFELIHRDSMPWFTKLTI